MQYLFPQLSPQYSRDVLSMQLRLVFAYAEEHFPECRALCLEARAAYRAVCGAASGQIEAQYAAFREYLQGVCQFYFYCGMALAIREFQCDACGDMDRYRDSLDERFFDFYESQYLSKLRRLAQAGVRANSYLIRNREAQRKHLALATKLAMSVRYLCVVAGYERMLLEFEILSDAFAADAQELAEVHRAFCRVDLCKELSAHACLLGEAIDPARQAALETRMQRICDAYLEDLRRDAELPPSALQEAARTTARLMAALRELPDG